MPSCYQCGLQFTNKASLNSHTKKTRHTPYICSCNATFSRLDVLDRHIQAFTSNASISCPYCQTKPKSFGRQDHLTQHLRGFHNMDIITHPNNTSRTVTSEAQEEDLLLARGLLGPRRFLTILFLHYNAALDPFRRRVSTRVTSEKSTMKVRLDA